MSEQPREVEGVLLVSADDQEGAGRRVGIRHTTRIPRDVLERGRGGGPVAELTVDPSARISPAAHDRLAEFLAQNSP